MRGILRQRGTHESDDGIAEGISLKLSGYRQWAVRDAVCSARLSQAVCLTRRSAATDGDTSA
jgi:hypothetical protein